MAFTPLNIAISIIVLIAIVAIVATVVKAKKNGNMTDVAGKIEGFVMNALQDVLDAKAVSSTGFDNLESYTISYVINKLQAAGILSGTELALITPDFIKSLIGTKLKELFDAWEKKHRTAPAPVAPADPTQAPVAPADTTTTETN